MEGDDVHAKLLSKISSQAVQLGDLNKALCGSAEYIEICQSRIIDLEKAAVLDSKRRDAREQSLVDDDARSRAHSKNLIAQMEQELRVKSRQCSLNEKKIVDLGREMQKIRAQLDISQRALRFSSQAPPSKSKNDNYNQSTQLNQANHSNQSNQSVITTLKNEIESQKSFFQEQLEESKMHERTMALKVSVLEETLENQSKYTGSKGHAELLAKVTNQRRLIRKLKGELEKNRIDIAGATAALSGSSDMLSPTIKAFNASNSSNNSYKHNKHNKQNTHNSHNKHDNHEKHDKSNAFYEFDTKSSSLDDSVSTGTCASTVSSHEEKVAAFEEIISSLQKKLTEAEKELKSFGAGGMQARCGELEGERDTLLEYIQSDMLKSSEISSQLEKSPSDLSECKYACNVQEERATHNENNYHTELSRATALAVELNTCQRKIENIEEMHLNENNERNAEAKKGAHIISVLRSELKIARGRVVEVEKIQSSLENYNGTLKSLLKTANTAKNDDKNDKKKGNNNNDNNNNGNNRSDINESNYNMSAQSSNSSSSSNGDLLNPSAPIPAEYQQSKKLTQELLLLRKKQVNWRNERAVLLNELEAPSAIDLALAELTADLQHLKSKESNPINDEHPPPPPSTRTHTHVSTDRNTDRDHRSSNPQSRSNNTTHTSQTNNTSVSHNNVSHNNATQTGNVSHTQIPRYMRNTSTSPARTRIDSRIEARTENVKAPSKISQNDERAATYPVAQPAPQPVQQYVPQSISLPPYPLSNQHRAWVDLPSLKHLPPTLYENIMTLYSDLYNSESKYTDLQETSKSSRIEYNTARTLSKNEILNLIATTKIQEREIIEIKKNLERKKLELLRESKASDVLDQVIIAFLSAPGGWGMFTDTGVESPPTQGIQHTQHTQHALGYTPPGSDTPRLGLTGLVSTGSSGWSTSSNISPSHSYDSAQRRELVEFDKSPGPRKSLSVSWINKSSKPSLSYDSGRDNNNKDGNNRDSVGRVSLTSDKGGEMGAVSVSGSGSGWSGERIPVDMISSMVTRAISIASAASISLQTLEESLSNITSELSDTRSSLRISKGEYEYLFTQLEGSRVRESSINESYSNIEKSLRNDLDAATGLVEQQNRLIVASESKVQTLVREKHIINAQLTAINQHESNATHKLITILAELGPNLGINPKNLPVKSSGSDRSSDSLKDVIECVENLLVKLVHSYKLHSARINYPIVRENNRDNNTDNNREIMVNNGGVDGVRRSLEREHTERTVSSAAVRADNKKEKQSERRSERRSVSSLRNVRIDGVNGVDRGNYDDYTDYNDFNGIDSNSSSASDSLRDNQGHTTHRYNSSSDSAPSVLGSSHESHNGSSHRSSDGSSFDPRESRENGGSRSSSSKMKDKDTINNSSNNNSSGSGSRKTVSRYKRSQSAQNNTLNGSNENGHTNNNSRNNNNDSNYDNSHTNNNNNIDNYKGGMESAGDFIEHLKSRRRNSTGSPDT